MKVKDQLKYPDLIEIIFMLVFFVLTILGWPDSKRPFSEFVFGMLLGALIPIIGVYFQKNQLRKVPRSQLHKKPIQPYILFLAIIGFLTIYVPVFVKFWLFAIMTGFYASLVVMLLTIEVKNKKRYMWNELNGLFDCSQIDLEI